MKNKLIITAIIFSIIIGGVILTDYNIQMGQRNNANTEWDKYYPVTKSNNVIMQNNSTLTDAIELKADQSFVDSQFASIVSGAPKGTYTDLTALQTAYPTGTNGIFLVLADGHWYYWNNTTSAWTDGGIYQATGIADKSVTPLKTSFINVTEVVIGKNLFNPNDSDVLIGKYHDRTNAVIVNANINETGYIPVKAGNNYVSSIMGVETGFVKWYDINKNFLGYTDFNLSIPYVTAIANAYYVKMTSGVATWSNFQVEEGTVKTAYEPYTPVKEKGYIYETYINNSWEGKKWVSFGDSITAREKWQPYVVSALGLVHTNCGIGFTALAGPDLAGGASFWQDSRLNTVKAANPDVVTIMGGANDHYYDITIGTDAEFDKPLATKDKNNFKGAYSYIIENLLTWKPTLRIILLTTTWGTNNNADEEINLDTGLTHRDFAQATKEVAWYYGLDCIDLRGEMGLNKVNWQTYLEDNVHPNDLGAKRIAEIVIAEFKSIKLIN